MLNSRENHLSNGPNGLSTRPFVHILLIVIGCIHQGVVDAEDALIAALKVKIQRPEALIAYVRQQNKRGDTRHPMRWVPTQQRERLV